MKTTKDTRERILDVAYEEFYTNGYNGTGLNTILEKAGIQKGSLYHFFSSKKELGLAVINEKIAERFRQRYEYFPEHEKPLAKLFEFMENPANFDLIRGCPMGKLINELASNDEEFRVALESIYSDLEQRIADVLTNAIEKNEIKPCNIKEVADFILSVLVGTIQRAKVGNTEQIFSTNTAILKNYITTLD